MSSLAMKTLLSPLNISDADSDKGMASETSVGTSEALHHCASLNADCLLSPVNPATWKGASPRARFGLDIGGTLCKVVYFEPLDNLDSSTPLSRGADFFTADMPLKSIKNDFRQGKKGVQHVELRHEGNSSEMPLALEECCCSLELLNISQESEEIRDQISCKASPAGLWLGDRNEQGCISNGVEGGLEQSASISCQFHQPVSRREDLPNWTLDCSRDYVSNPNCCNHVRKLWASSHDPVILPGRGTLYFKCFETWRMEEFLFLTKEHSLVQGRRALGATGGGARKFGSQFLEIAGLQLNRVDELGSLVRGIDFLMKYAQHESFEYPKGSFQGGLIQRPFRSPDNSSNDSDENLSEEENSHSFTSEKTVNGKQELAKSKMGATILPKGLSESGGCHEDRTLYPYLVVNIGSGVSILLVESPEQFERVGGTSLGGSTFFGLASVLTGCTSYKEAIDLAADGDSTEIDMLVGDIYGGDYSEMGLAATTVASSFGKLVQPERRATAIKSPHHLAKATLLMITNNIGSLAKLHAQATGVKHVLFTGSFMHGNKLAMRLLAVAMEFWSKGQIKANFLRHEGHAGAMGALLNALDPANPTDALLLS
eukprot:c18960_g1_i2 orf=531-2330(+)